MAQELVLHSPVGAEAVVYPWPLTSGGVSMILEGREPRARIYCTVSVWFEQNRILGKLKPPGRVFLLLYWLVSNNLY